MASYSPKDARAAPVRKNRVRREPMLRKQRYRWMIRRTARSMMTRKIHKLVALKIRKIRKRTVY